MDWIQCDGWDILLHFACENITNRPLSAVRTDHKAIIAFTNLVHLQPINKRRHQRRFRRKSPTQHATFFEYVSTLNIELDNGSNVQANFAATYDIMGHLLNRVYPEWKITVTASNPPYVTPLIKALLRCKNRLMRAGRTEETGAIALRIRTTIMLEMAA